MKDKEAIRGPILDAAQLVEIVMDQEAVVDADLKGAEESALKGCMKGLAAFLEGREGGRSEGRGLAGGFVPADGVWVIGGDNGVGVIHIVEGGELTEVIWAKFAAKEGVRGSPDIRGRVN